MKVIYNVLHKGDKNRKPFGIGCVRQYIFSDSVARAPWSRRSPHRQGDPPHSERIERVTCVIFEFELELRK